jgi:CHAT domain-containing protein
MDGGKPELPEQNGLSVSESVPCECPLCGHRFTGERWRVIDAGEHPELVARAIDGSLGRSFCPRCIGPGVDHPGSFAIAARDGAGVEWIALIAGEVEPLAAETLAAEARSLRFDLLQRCDTAGIESVTAGGIRWIQEPGDVLDMIEEVWPDRKVPLFDPAMLGGPLVALLNAEDPAGRAAALLDAPDLARPNIETLLSRLAAGPDEAKAIAAARALHFTAAAKCAGVAEALRQAMDEEARRARLAQLPAELATRIGGFLGSEFAGAAPRQIHELAADLSASLDSAGFPGAAEVWSHAGTVLRRRPDVIEAMPLAADAFSRALHAVEPGRAWLQWSILIGLSSAWDLRRDGDRGRNVEMALEFAARAREAARTLPADSQAEAAMEQGIIYTHRPAGDAVSNLLLAREALLFARRTALSGEMRNLALYNLGLAEIEDDRTVSTGIARLEALAGEEAALSSLDAQQQQNLWHSLGVALAKRAVEQGEPRAADFDRAAEYLDRALRIARQRSATAAQEQPRSDMPGRSKPSRDVAFLAGLLARVEADRLMRGRDARDFGSIIALLEEASSALDPAIAPIDYAEHELRRASILADLCEPELASVFVADALGNACRVLSPEDAPDLFRRAKSELGNLRYREGNYRGAADAFAAACSASEVVYRQTESVSQRAVEAGRNASLYEGLVDSLARLSREDPGVSWQLLEAMEAGRARLALDLMGLRPLPPFPGVPADLVAREAELIAELDWTVPGGSGEFAREDPDRLRRQREVQTELRELWDRIGQSGDGGRRHAELRRSRPPDRAQIAAFAARLGERTAIASFFVLRDRLLLVWLRAGMAPRVEPVDLPAKALREDWIAGFRREVLDGGAGSAPRVHGWLHLGELLFAPVAGELSALDLLVVIPHQDLHGLPIHALAVGGQPLIERVPVIYGQSIGVLASIAASAESRPEEAALVASYAASAADRAEFEAEAEAVARRFGVHARRQADASTLAQWLPRVRAAHIVCHGHFDPDHPLDSGIELAGGVMRARDWLTLSLACELVTLSACETGRQQVEAGDELNGLARAILQAGAGGVLVALWRVYSDATAYWMERFYAHAGDPARRRYGLAWAFQQATLEIRSRDPDVKAWAPFVLMGAIGRPAPDPAML